MDKKDIIINLDRFLKFIKDENHFIFSDQYDMFEKAISPIFREVDLKDQPAVVLEFQKCKASRDGVKKMMEDFGYIENPNLVFFKLSDTGKAAKRLGHIEYQNRIISIDELSYKKLQYDTKNSMRVYNTYWLTVFIAVTSFIISIVLLILKLKE